MKMICALVSNEPGRRYAPYAFTEQDDAKELQSYLNQMLPQNQGFGIAMVGVEDLDSVRWYMDEKNRSVFEDKYHEFNDYEISICKTLDIWDHEKYLELKDYLTTQYKEPQENQYEYIEDDGYSFEELDKESEELEEDDLVLC